MTEHARKKILFVGAGGMLAAKILPTLAQHYDIIGIAGKRQELKQYCVDFYSCDLLTEYKTVFKEVLAKHVFDGIVWNPVAYYLKPLLESTRESFHIEFDIGVVLPLELVRMLVSSVAPNVVFVLVSSLSAYGYSPRLATYGVIKRAQLRLVHALSHELGDRMIFKAIAPGSVPKISTEQLVRAFTAALENSEPSETLYKIPN
jgi:NAD(P)-dependent dehydrogenase (short-subunit alcohol dehydrogenase family)